MEKITKREHFQNIIDMMDGAENKYTSEQVIEFCLSEIAHLDKRAEKARENAAKKKAEGDDLTQVILASLSCEEFKTINDIMEAINDESVTPNKITYRLGQLFKNDLIEKNEISIAGKDGQKARKVKAYRRLGE